MHLKPGSFLNRKYNLTRSLTSRNDNQPSGQIEGHATFTALEHLPDCLLYHEKGTFYMFSSTAQTQPLHVSRSYIWKFAPSGDALSIYFTKPRVNPHSKPEMDYLFLSLQFEGNDGLSAVDVHPCGKDIYAAKYEFHKQSFLIYYQVTSSPDAPLHSAKDYTSDTLYTLCGVIDQDDEGNPAEVEFE